MINETFTTHITFTHGGGSHTEETPASEVTNTIKRLLAGPAAAAGMIKEVKMVDANDSIVFLSRDNKVLFPRPNTK